MNIKPLNTARDFRARYDYTAKLSRSRWAWEFLRRNAEFRSEALEMCADAVSSTRCAALDRVTLLKQRDPDRAAEAWGLIFFPHPDVTALKAEVFWSDDLFPSPVGVHVIACAPNLVDPIFKKTLEKCDVSHLRDANDREHLLLRGAGCVVQSRCTGLSLMSKTPYRLHFVLDNIEDLQDKIATLNAATEVYGDDDVGPPRWSARGERYRNMLIALDAKDAGLTLRQTAEIIHGKSHVAANWSNDNHRLKDSIRRLRRSGEALRAGGYKQLLLAKKTGE